MSERDALLLEYPMEDDDLVTAAQTTYHTSPDRSTRRGSNYKRRVGDSMTMTSLHATHSSTDEDLIDAGANYSSSATS